ncbi:hypothetical protein, partial [Sinorhizobium meliloti]|uniref:hypothetical protein n=1 Tax=Rhizobium meliloti TaxID=382 RepID=UPI001AED0305
SSPAQCFRISIAARVHQLAISNLSMSGLWGQLHTQQQAHHQGYVDDIKGQLEGKGYNTTSGGFFSKCGSTVCYPDIIYSRPGSTRVDGVIEIKTGGAGPSTGQSAVYPQIGTGDAVPLSGFVQNWNESNPNSLLKAGVPMNQQGYPDGIPVYQITAPGLGQ